VWDGLHRTDFQRDVHQHIALVFYACEAIGGQFGARFAASLSLATDRPTARAAKKIRVADCRQRVRRRPGWHFGGGTPGHPTQVFELGTDTPALPAMIDARTAFMICKRATTSS
jgi:hypothetical protein